MSLIGKVFHDEEPYIDNHKLAALLRLWFVGETTKVQTVADIETMIDTSLTTPENNQLDEWKATHDALSTSPAQNKWMLNLESTLVLAEGGAGVYLTKAKFKTINGLTTD